MLRSAILVALIAHTQRLSIVLGGMPEASRRAGVAGGTIRFAGGGLAVGRNDDRRRPELFEVPCLGVIERPLRLLGIVHRLRDGLLDGAIETCTPRSDARDLCVHLLKPSGGAGVQASSCCVDATLFERSLLGEHSLSEPALVFSQLA